MKENHILEDNMHPSGQHTMFYFAILCPPEINRKVVQYKNWMKEQCGCIVALKSPAHITLIPPFWLKSSREAELQHTMESFNSSIPALEIGLDGFSHFGKRVLFIQVTDNAALKELQAQVEDYFRQSFDALVKKSDRPFHPHVTIANRDLKPMDFSRAWNYFSKKGFSETFHASSFSLLKLDEGKWKIAGNWSWFGRQESSRESK